MRLSKFLINIFSVSILLGLSACSTMQEATTNHDNDYIQQGKSVAPTKLPQNLSASMQTYYPIPPVTMGPLQQPSLIPPGSQMAQTQMRQIAQRPIPVHTSNVVASTSNAFVLNAPFDQAWNQTGNALRSSGYKVMQQDKGLGAFYILDLAGTGGQLKTNTPIYELHLKSSGDNTSVTLYDDKGNPANATVGGRIMGALKRNL